MELKQSIIDKLKVASDSKFQIYHEVIELQNTNDFTCIVLKSMGDVKGGILQNNNQVVNAFTTDSKYDCIFRDLNIQGKIII